MSPSDVERRGGVSDDATSTSPPIPRAYLKKDTTASPGGERTLTRRGSNAPARVLKRRSTLGRRSASFRSSGDWSRPASRASMASTSMLSFAGEGNPRSVIKKRLAAATRPFVLKSEQKSKLEEQAREEKKRTLDFQKNVTTLLKTLADLKKQVSAPERSDEDIIEKIGETSQMVQYVAGKVSQLQDRYSKLVERSLKQTFVEEHHENVIQSLQEVSKDLVNDLFRTEEGKEFWEDEDLYENELEEKDELIETHMEDQVKATEEAPVEKVKPISMIIRAELGPASSPKRTGFMEDDTKSEVSEDEQQEDTKKGSLDLGHAIQNIMGPSQAPKRAALERRDTIQTEASEVPTAVSETKIKKARKSKKQREKARQDKKNALANVGPVSAGSSTGTTGSSAEAQSTLSGSTSEAQVNGQEMVPSAEAGPPSHTEEPRPERDDLSSAPSSSAASAPSKSSGPPEIRQETASRLLDNEVIDGQRIDDAFDDPTRIEAFERSLLAGAAPPSPELEPTFDFWFSSMQKEPPFPGSRPPSLSSSLPASVPSSAGRSLSPRSPAKPLAHELRSAPASAKSQHSINSHKVEGEAGPGSPTQTSAKSAAASRAAGDDEKSKAAKQSPEPFEETSDPSSSSKTQGASSIAGGEETKPSSVDQVKFQDSEMTEDTVPHTVDGTTGHNEDSKPTRPIIPPVVSNGEKPDVSILPIIKSQITPWRDLLYCVWIMFIVEPFLSNMDMMMELRAWLRWHILGRQSPWTPHAKRKIGMDPHSVAVVLLHCFIMLTIQVWVATTRERQIWMMANLRTRDYLISRVYEDPSLAFLPGVDPHLMLGTPAASAVVMGAWHFLEDAVLPKLSEFQVQFLASVMPIFLWV